MDWDTSPADSARLSRGARGATASSTQLWKTWDHKANKNGVHKTVYWASGEQYAGEWLDNKKHGKGTMVYKNGDKYEGEWEENVRSGLGVYWVYDAGRYRVRYNGSWLNDLPHGEGVLFADNGDMYQGEFMSGMRHGRGKQVYGGDSGDVYEGDWVNDKRHGHGTLSRGNGDVYEGSWFADAKQGEGTYYFIGENKRYDGVWMQDRPRCGQYSEIQDTGPGSASALPVLELADGRDVYSRAKEAVAQRLAQAGVAHAGDLEVAGEESSVVG